MVCLRCTFLDRPGVGERRFSIACAGILVISPPIPVSVRC